MKQKSSPSKRNTHSFEQLSLFGASESGNYYESETWGLLTFFPTRNNDPDKNCRHCLLRCEISDKEHWQECVNAPCCADQRKDGRNGYFSIHDMPGV